jgi:hypothetical protein
MAAFDLYNLLFPGGVCLEPVAASYVEGVRRMDMEIPAPPVDEDSSGSMLREAIAQYRNNIYRHQR